MAGCLACVKLSLDERAMSIISPKPGQNRSILRSLMSSNVSELKSYMALCLIVKDQGQDLVEWIEWHR